MDNEELARAWMESPHWGGWRSGMVTDAGLVITDVSDDHPASVWVGNTGRRGDRWIPTANPLSVGIPDLTNSGTEGFLLEDVRGAWKGFGVDLSFDRRPSVRIRIWEDAPEGKCHSFQSFNLARALIAALQAAPQGGPA